MNQGNQELPPPFGEIYNILSVSFLITKDQCWKAHNSIDERVCHLVEDLKQTIENKPVLQNYRQLRTDCGLCNMAGLNDDNTCNCYNARHRRWCNNIERIVSEIAKLC
jgi:hypothetical protein